MAKQTSSRRVAGRSSAADNVKTLQQELTPVPTHAETDLLRNYDQYAELLRDGVLLYDLIENDPWLFGELDSMRMDLISFPWDVKSGGDAEPEQKAAQLFRESLTRIGFDLVTLDMTSSWTSGVYIGELMYAVKDGYWVLDRVLHRNPARFAFDRQGRLWLKPSVSNAKPQLMPANKFLVYSFGGKYGNPYGSGFGRKLYDLVSYKQELFRRLAAYWTRVSNGTVEAIVENGTDEDLAAALGMARTIVNGGVVAHTGAAEFKREEPSSSAGGIFKQALEIINSEITKCIKGSSSESGSGSKAVHSADTPSGVSLTRLRAYADALSVPLNGLAHTLTELNGGPDVVPPTVYRKIGEDTQFMAQVQRDHYIAAFGYRPNIDSIQERFGDYWEEAPENKKTPPFVSGVTGG